MPRKAHDLSGAIASFPALYVAAHRSATGKRGKPGVTVFLADLECELQGGRYRIDRFLEGRRLRLHPRKGRMAAGAGD